MYTLYLTKAEREEFDLIGNRMPHGHALRAAIEAGQIVSLCGDDDDFDRVNWDSDSDLEYEFDQPQADEISRIVDDSSLGGFSPELVKKLRDFSEWLWERD